MADTITILNGLDHEQDITTSIIYDIDHATTECCGMKPVHIPRGKSANIIFNNTYDADGSTVFVMVRMVRMTSATTPTYTESSVLAWQEIAQNAVLETGAIDSSASWDTTLHIFIALSSTTAHTGTEIIVQAGSEDGTDGSWSLVTRYIGPIGTAVSCAFAATEPAGETTIAITNPVTNNMDNDGKFKFVENTVAADSEIVYQTANSGD
jgi:hypothetical protein